MDEMMLDLEQIDLSEEEWEDVKKLSEFNKVDYPALCITKSNFYFNKAALPLFKDAVCIKYKLSPNYLLIERFNKKVDNAFHAYRQHGTTGIIYGVQTCIPSDIKCRAINTGIYKLYKSGDRLVVKRWEPAED